MIKKALKKNKLIYYKLVKKYESFLVSVKRIKSIRHRLKPLDLKKIVFDNFSGKGYGGSPRFIAEEIIKQNKDYDLVWLVNDLNSSLPDGIRKVKANTDEAYYELSTARVWVDNVKDSNRPRKRKNQFYIQTWHGGAGIKTAERDAEESLPYAYLRKSKRDSKEIDVFVAETKMTYNSLQRTFWYSGDVIKASFNRYNFDRESIRHEVLRYFCVDEDIKILLYVPTFRKDERLDCYNIDFERILNTLEDFYGGKWVAIIRLHPVIARYCHSIHYNSRVLDGTYYNSVEALISSSDIVITDFSNCMFDGYRLKKKVFLYASDYEEYVSTDRKLYFDLESMPSPMCKNNDELIYAIENMDDREYENKRKKLIEDIGYYEDDAALICCDRIVNLLDE